MATIVSNPVLTWIATIMAEAGLAGSSNLTATFQITSGWEVRIPFRGVQAANVSAGPEIWIYEAVAFAAGTPKFSTVPLAQIGLTRSASGDDTSIVRLDTGIYCARLISGGPNTATVGLLTAQVLTGVNNV